MSTDKRMLDDFNADIERYRRDWQIPGLAVGIVQGDDIVYADGFGLADVARNLPATAGRPFCIASCTKAFTAIAAAILVEEGVVSWDTPVREYIPSFRMFDPIASARMTLRDMLSHRTGLPFGGHDWMRITTTASRAELLQRVAYLEPNLPFRSAFQYSNLIYILVGAVIEQLTGQSWEAFVRRRIFIPLGMTETCFETDPFEDQFTDYVQDGDGFVPIDELWEPNLLQALIHAPGGPCGSIISTISDMCKWLQAQFPAYNSTEPALVSANTLRELHTIQIPCPGIFQGPEFSNGGCAMGWLEQHYRGHRLVHHWGGGAGPTFAAVLPEASIGVIVHSNLADQRFYAINAIALNAIDRMLGLDVLPWHERWLREAPAGVTVLRPAAQPGTPEALPGEELLPFTGMFTHPGYGSLEVQARDGQLTMHYQSFIFHLHQDGDNSFVSSLANRVPPVLAQWWGQRKVTVIRSADGKAHSMAIPFEPSVADIVFLQNT